MKDFNPNAAATKDSGIFGLPFSPEEARLVLLPIPWEVTTSYGRGTAHAPQAILKASQQVDLFHLELGNFFTQGIAMLEPHPDIETWNKTASDLAQIIIAQGGCHDDPKKLAIADQVNQYSHQLNAWVYEKTKECLAQGKRVGIVGGDHSTPFGAIQALQEAYPNMGILHLDAHADLRNAYEGFTDSHASIMYNVITRTSLKTLIQVGIRDFCEEEYHFMAQHSDRIQVFYDAFLFEEKAQGVSWAKLCDKIVSSLPEEVYVSFDIDGLDPRFCPHTGTPVPGGLDFNEALYLLKHLIRAGKKIIGFDLTEVSPGLNDQELTQDEVSPGLNDQELTQDSASEWDANVGARILYQLCGLSLFNQVK